MYIFVEAYEYYTPNVIFLQVLSAADKSIAKRLLRIIVRVGSFMPRMLQSLFQNNKIVFSQHHS
jgi:hypothetical protein